MRTEKENVDLFVSNEGLIYSIYIKYFKWFKVHKEDLILAGRLGLWKACLKYDETKAKFSSYACSCIKNEMCLEARREIKANSRLTSYEIITPDGEEYNVVEMADNGQYEEMIDDAEMELLVRDLKHKEMIKKYLNGDTLTNIAKEEKLTRQAISKRFLNEKDKLLDKIH